MPVSDLRCRHHSTCRGESRPEEARRVNNKALVLFHKRLFSSKVAIITLATPEHVATAIDELDNFNIDDGEVSRPMRLIAYADHLHSMLQPMSQVDKKDQDEDMVCLFNPCSQKLRPLTLV